ncbi:hypothetical protein GW776_05310 [archaeon]|nr:hypothetical protein [archaeon]
MMSTETEEQRIEREKIDNFCETLPTIWLEGIADCRRLADTIYFSGSTPLLDITAKHIGMSIEDIEILLTSALDEFFGEE